MDGDSIPFLPVDSLVDAERSGIDGIVENDEPDASARAVENATVDRLERATIAVDRTPRLSRRWPRTPRPVG